MSGCARVVSDAPAPADPLAGLGARVVRNLSMLSVSQVAGLGISIITVSLLSRALSVAEFGAFNYAFALLSFGLMLADPGLTTTLVRDVAQTQAPGQVAIVIQRALGLKLTLASVVTIVFLAGAWWRLEEPVRTATMILILVVPVQAWALATVVLMARVQIKRGVAIELVTRLAGFAALVAALALGWGLPGALMAVLIGELAGVIATGRLTWSVVRPRPRMDLGHWRALLRASLTVGGASILAVLVNRLDFLMLERLVGANELGYYGAAYRLPQLLERVPLLALATVFPLMSQLAADDRGALRTLYRWSLVRAWWLAVAAVTVAQLVAPQIVTAWMGTDYLPSVPALRWLLLATGCIYLAVVAGNVLVAIRQTRVSLVIWMVAAPLNVALNWWWIPRAGATGAAAATCVTFVVVLLASLVAVERLLPPGASPTDVDGTQA